MNGPVTPRKHEGVGGTRRDTAEIDRCTSEEESQRPRLIIDLDSTEDPAHGSQEGVSYNGHFEKNCYHPLFCFTSEGDCLAVKLREGTVHSADGTLEMLSPIVDRHRKRFKRFWLRADTAFGKPEIYDYCETNRITYFIRLKSNPVLQEYVEPDLRRPVGRPAKSGKWCYWGGTWSVFPASFIIRGKPCPGGLPILPSSMHNDRKRSG